MTATKFDAAKTLLRLWMRRFTPKRNRTPYRRTSRLFLEQLENRVTPSTITWTGANHAVDNNWSDGLNWQGGVAPGSGDIANFTASGTQSFTSNVDKTFTVAGVTIDGTWGGTINVNSSLTVKGNLTLASGSFGGAGGIGVSSGALNYNGGTLSSSVTLANSALNFGSGGTGAASFVLEGADTLSGNVSAEQSLWVQGNGTYGNATLTAQGNVSNAGTIQLQSSGGGYAEVLSSGGNTFTNATGGTIQVNAGSGGGRYLEGTFTNATGATVSVAANITLWVNDSAAATFTNQGQMNVDANGLMIIEHTYNADGGTIAGPGYVYSGVLEESTNATPTTIQVAGNTTLATNNLANMVIAVQGNSALNQNATLTAQGNLTNYGTIQLQSSGGAYSDTISSGSGTFTNAAKGIIQVNANGGGGRYLEGTFTNATGATINVVAGQTLSIGGSNWSNAGTINVSNDTLDLSGLNGSAFTNTSHGVINFDTTNGNAVISANDTLSNAGTINVTGTKVLYLENGFILSNTSTGKLNFTNDSSLSQSGSGYLVNAGTVEKTKGTGTSTISTSSLNNTGTVAVYSGTLDVTAPVTQVSGTTLTAGSWSAYGSATVSATLTIGGSAGSINAIGAKVTLSGLNSSFTNINGAGGLNTILAGGSFSILGGQSFTTAGSLTNNGKLTVGPGSILTATGSFTEASTASLAIQLGGTSSAPTKGQVVSTSGTVTLGGTLQVTSTVVPAVGSTFEILANQGGSPISGTFAGLAEGATFTVKSGSTTMTFQITYVGGGGNNVVIKRIS